MLILIPGLTGNLGHHLARAALKRGHSVRGLGRTPDKLDSEIRSKLESFVQDDSTPQTYDNACKGVDAVLNGWSPKPKLIVETQLQLLRAAERAGIKRFHAASWNFDWEDMPLGQIETYDSLIVFANYARSTSPIHPTYAFVGMLANTLFGVPGAGSMEGDSAIWAYGADGKRIVRTVGNGNAKLNYTTEAEAADFSVALITSDLGEKGGFYRFCSDSVTMCELAAAYKKVRRAEAEVSQLMGVDECEKMWRGMRADIIEKRILHEKSGDIVGLQYGWYTGLGSNVTAFEPVDAAKFPDVKRTSIEDYIRENDYV